jgi:prepilin-type N-terminal cleavage/methylation domain-containing protein/prepilin-type processing-associated H-X9-DG protein
MIGCSRFHSARGPGKAVSRKRRGFTLVELLVVIGIIAVLLGILLASLSKARESGRSVKCLGNLRTLGVAMFSYVQRYDRFPRPAANPLAEDWFHWTNVASHKKVRGGIAEFLDDGGPTSSSVWLCPSDDLDTHTQRNGNLPSYPYSYSVNFNICVYQFHPNISPTDTLRFTKIRQPEQKILIIDESSETVDDGCWAWQWNAGSGYNMLSNRHDRRKEAATNVNAGYGNVSFADGHAERVPRVKSFDPKYYDPFLPGKSPLPAPTVPQMP